MKIQHQEEKKLIFKNHNQGKVFKKGKCENELKIFILKKKSIQTYGIYIVFSNLFEKCVTKSMQRGIMNYDVICLTKKIPLHNVN